MDNIHQYNLHMKRAQEYMTTVNKHLDDLATIIEEFGKLARQAKSYISIEEKDK